jgi:hypothetical protein
MIRSGEVARLLGSGFGELDDRIDDRLEALVAEHDGAEHDILGQFLGFGFDHQNGVGRACHDQVEFEDSGISSTCGLRT